VLNQLDLDQALLQNSTLWTGFVFASSILSRPSSQSLEWSKVFLSALKIDIKKLNSIRVSIEVGMKHGLLLCFEK
jgi:hypothetical protein